MLDKDMIKRLSHQTDKNRWETGGIQQSFSCTHPMLLLLAYHPIACSLQTAKPDSHKTQDMQFQFQFQLACARISYHMHTIAKNNRKDDDTILGQAVPWCGDSG
ncbi:hypothetical protein PoB_006758600 [Plakobranchus ocellatus]|uniref:Uncharacterized protein n=1 Tax=Plakobranchus ocellatus TaxID=259542 RepID=A0AAV4DA83_9GAST|nr:hypothetical protein PoB_006758600 [Plakobranchus ocellatus]